MRTIALRFSDSFAPKSGTIAEHKKIINKRGFVWYGKLGNKISPKIFASILANGPVRILMIKTGSTERYWATLEEVSYEKQDIHPDYYEQEAAQMNTWLKISKFETADDDILEKCIIPSTGNKLSEIYKKSMGSYFNIDVDI
jgi:hypothetical protein